MHSQMRECRDQHCRIADAACRLSPLAAHRPSCRIAHACRHYRSSASFEVARWRHNLGLLSERHKALVPRLADKVGARLLWAFIDGLHPPTLPSLAPSAPPSPTQITEAQQCIYRNHLFLSAMLAMFEEGSELAPPHLATANAAADELEETAGAAVAPADHDKVMCVCVRGRGDAAC